MNIKPRPTRHLPLSAFKPPHRPIWVGCNPLPTEVTVYLPLNILEEMFGHGRAHPRTEVGGYLFGLVYIGDEKAAVQVEGLFPIVSKDATLSHFRFRIEDSHQAEQFQQRHYPDTDIVGWYHTHPGHGVFMSSVDENTHNKYFPPFHRFAVVIDPINLAFGAYAHKDEEVYALPSIHVVDPSVDGSRALALPHYQELLKDVPGRPKPDLARLEEEPMSSEPAHSSSERRTNLRGNQNTDTGQSVHSAENPPRIFGVLAISLIVIGLVFEAGLVTWTAWLLFQISRKLG